MRPSAAIHQGTLRVAYESHGSGAGNTPRQIVIASADGAGGFTYDVISSTHFGEANRPRLHVGAGDAMWIDWIDGNNDLAWASWQPSAGWGGVQIETFSDYEDLEFHARGRVKQLANP